jgi:hypothetical protein
LAVNVPKRLVIPRSSSFTWGFSSVRMGRRLVRWDGSAASRDADGPRLPPRGRALSLDDD